MEDRRRFLKVSFLTAFGFGALGLTGADEELLAAGKQAPSGGSVYDPRKRRSIPDVPGTTHTGQPFRFYRDLVKDKVVTINFMSIQGEAGYPVTARMKEIAHRLGDKLGRDVFMISVTRDPGNDSPERLAAFAAENRVPKGWVFVNCALQGSNVLQSRIYHSHQHSHPTSVVGHPSGLRKTDTVFYGNGGLGLWSNFPVEIHPDEAVRHISWVMPGRKPTGEPRRAGPRPLNSAGRQSDNRIV